MTTNNALGLPNGFPKTKVYSQVGHGWWPIISQLDICLRKLDPDYVVEEISERFGGLKYCFALSQPVLESKDYQTIFHSMKALVEFSEALSYRTCQLCGCPAKLYNQDGHIKSMCEKHAEANQIFNEIVSNH